MGAGTIQMKNYRSIRGYYTVRDTDSKVGGPFTFLIEPLDGEDDIVFFYVRTLDNGMYEVEGEGYVITNSQRLFHYRKDAKEKSKGKRLFYYHVNDNGEVIREEEEIRL